MSADRARCRILHAIFRPFFSQCIFFVTVVGFLRTKLAFRLRVTSIWQDLYAQTVDMSANGLRRKVQPDAQHSRPDADKTTNQRQIGNRIEKRQEASLCLGLTLTPR